MSEHDAEQRAEGADPGAAADADASNRASQRGTRPPQAATPASDRDPLEVVIEEFTERHRRGENPSIEEYVDRYPELAEDIRELLDAATAMERLKVRKERTPGGQVSLRGVQLERLGDFRIVREVGRGGMGIVYEAVQESLDRRVAVKVLPKQALLDEKHLRRFQREARTAARLHHTNIVPVLGVGHHEGYHYYVMQLIDGAGLDGDGGLAPTIGLEETKVARADPTREPTRPAALPDDTSPPPASGIASPVGHATEARAVARIGIQAADALQYAHEHGVLHRDVKPANLIQDSEGTVWVTDFGLAKVLEQENVTRSGDLVGTLRYIAPEQLRGIQDDARSDIYSLGITLYELVTGQAAFGVCSEARLMEKIVAGNIARPRQLDASIPRDLETIVLKAMACEPQDRYRSAGELAEDLRRFLDDQPLLARRTTAVEHVWRWCRRNRLTAASIGLAVALLVLVAASTSVGYVRTSAALNREKAERERAEAATEVGLNVLDRIFEQFAPQRFDPLQALLDSGADGDASDDTSLRPALSPDTAALLQSMLTFYDSLAEQSSDNRRFRLKAAQANRRIGDIRQHLGQFDEAVAAYGNASEIYEQLDASAGSGDIALAQAQIHNELGHVYRMTGQPDTAQQSHQKAMETLESVVSANAAPEVRYELAQTYYRLAHADRWAIVPPTGPTGEPRDWSPEPPLADHPPGSPPRTAGPPRDRRPPRESNDAHGPPPRHFGPDEGREFGEGETHRQQAYLGKAVDLLRELADQPASDPDHVAFLACVYHALGTLLQHANQQDEAVVNYRTAVSVQSDLVDRFPEKASYSIVLGWLEQPLARALYEQDELNEARRLLESSRDLLESELVADPDLVYLHGLIAHAGFQLADVLYELGQAQAADQARRQAEEHDRQMRRGMPRGRGRGPDAPHDEPPHLGPHAIPGRFGPPERP